MEAFNRTLLLEPLEERRVHSQSLEIHWRRTNHDQCRCRHGEDCNKREKAMRIRKGMV